MREKDIDVKQQKIAEERKERTGLDSRLNKLTRGLPVSVKVKISF